MFNMDENYISKLKTNEETMKRKKKSIDDFIFKRLNLSACPKTP